MAKTKTFSQEKISPFPRFHHEFTIAILNKVRSKYGMMETGTHRNLVRK
jgi:hypothetical protein